MVEIGILGRMKNGAVSSKTDQHVGAAQLILRIPKVEVLWELHAPALYWEGQTEYRIHTYMFQNAVGRLAAFSPRSR